MQFSNKFKISTAAAPQSTKNKESVKIPRKSAFTLVKKAEVKTTDLKLVDRIAILEKNFEDMNLRISTIESHLQKIPLSDRQETLQQESFTLPYQLRTKASKKSITKLPIESLLPNTQSPDQD